MNIGKNRTDGKGKDIPPKEPEKVFFNCLFQGDGGRIEIRAFTPQGKMRRHFFESWDVASALQQALSLRDSNVYVGMGLRDNSGQGAKKNTLSVAALWVDFDDKLTAREQSERAIKGFPLPPSAVIESGGGIHAYFFLKERVGVEHEAEVEKALQGLAKYLRSDPAVAEWARIMRVPGTYNLKYGEPRPVTVRSLKPDRRYDLGTILDLVAPPPPDEQPVAIEFTSSLETQSGKREYARKVIESCCKKIRESVPGEQHTARVNMARLAGGYAHYLDESAIEADLRRAVEDSGAEDLAQSFRDVAWGLRQGKLSPLTVPDRLRQQRLTPAEAKDRRAEFEARIDAVQDPQGDGFEELTVVIAGEVEQSSLPQASKQALFKRITKAAKTTLKALRRDLRDSCDDGSQSDEANHLGIARKVVDEIGAYNIVSDADRLFAYNNSGVWRLLEDAAVRKKIHRHAPANSLTQNNVNSILGMVKTEAFQENHAWNQSGRHVVNCLNGEVHWNGNSWEIRPHKREHYQTTQLPVEFDDTATAPVFMKFMGEIFEVDPDATEKALLVLEMMGYALMTSCEFEKFLMLIGQGANGKSVLLSVVEALVGPEQRCAVQPSQLDRSCQRAELFGKLVNIVTEVAEGAEIPDAALKSIVSGESMTADRKYGHPFTFAPFCTLLFAANHMPHTRDFSPAFFRRALIVIFNRVFAEHEQDKLLKQKLLMELPGILNLALEAFGGVLKRGHFTEPESSKEAAADWRRSVDQVQQFAEECTESAPDAWTPTQELYNAFKIWGEQQGLKRIVTQKSFVTRMQRLGAVPHRRPNARGMLGIRLSGGMAA